MESSPKFNFFSKQNSKIATAAVVSTMAIMGGISTAQIVKNNGGDQGKEEAKLPGDKPTETKESKTTPLEELSYEDLIKLLTHDEYQQRKAAHSFIWKQGKKIIPALENAINSDDPEIAVRVSDILRNLRIGVTYDTPKHIADKVSEFQTALLDKQDDILRFLYQERAYNQMVFMLAEMDNRDHAEKLHKNYKELPFLAARKALGDGNNQGAIELLKMSPQDPEVQRSLAFVYARTGLAQAEYERLIQLPNLGAEEKRWIEMLLQEMDDREMLREFSTSNGITHTLAVLDLLEGNPDPFISTMARKPNATQAMGTAVLKDIYAGKSSQGYADTHVKLLTEAQTQRRMKKFMPMNVLYLTGGEKLGESILLENAPHKAFSLLDERERPVEALAAIGLTDDASIIKWRDQLIAKILAPKKEQGNNLRRDQDIDYIDEEQLILQVAGLYARHGAEDKSRLILTPLLTSLYKDDKEHWSNFIADLPRYNMHEVAMHYILAQSKEEDFAAMLEVLFDGSEYVGIIWRELLKREDSMKDSFKDLAVLMGMHRDQEKLRSELEAYLIQSAKKQGLEDLHNMQNALYILSDFRYDSISASNYLDEVLKKKEDEETERARIQEQFTLDALNLDWKSLLQLFEKNPEFGARSSEWLTIKSIAEREEGNVEKANKLLERAMLLTVGRGDEINEIISELVWGGEMKYVNAIFERQLLINADPAAAQSYPFIRALGILANGDSHYLLSGQWGKAAAMAYASNYVSMTYLQDTMSDPDQLKEMMNMNFVLNFARGMEFHQNGEHEKAKNLLGEANQGLVGDGALADIFYPAVRKTPYQKEFERWVQKSYDHLISAISEFPKASNTRNTLAWILSRSVSKLDDGIKHSAKALELAPNEAAYLDTMAELWFAKGDREKAVEWGNKAVKSSKSGQLLGRASQTMTKARTLSLYGQLKRFKTEPLPSE